MIRRRAVLPGLALASMLILAPAADAARFGSRTLRQGMSGSDVKTLQRYLDRVGQETTVDGEFGRGTARSVRGFEAEAGREVDAVVTKSDARALKTQVNSSAAPTASSRPSTATRTSRRSAATSSSCAPWAR